MVGCCERPDRKKAKKDSLCTFTVAQNICRVCLEGMNTSMFVHLLFVVHPWIVAAIFFCAIQSCCIKTFFPVLEFK